MSDFINHIDEERKLDVHCLDAGVVSNEYATMEVAARYLGVSIRQARHLCKNGHIGIKYGQRTWIITRKELIEFKPNKPAIGRPRKKRVEE